jgi:hypothetical protein
VSPLALVRVGLGPTYVLVQACCVHPDGSVSVRRGAAWDVVIASSAPGVFPFDRWVYLEYGSSLWATGTPAQGRCDVRVDGTVVVSATAVQTCDGTPRLTSDVRIGNCLPDGNPVVVDLDDFVDYLTTDTTNPEPGAPPFQGRTTVACLYPVGPGDLTGFTAVGAPTNWQANAESIADGDASYVTKTAGADPYDLYRVAAPGPAVPVLPVDDNAPSRPAFDAHLGALVRDAGSTTLSAGVLIRFTDATNTAQNWDYRQDVQAAYQYSFGNLDPTQRAMQTLQVGWGGPASVTGHQQDVYRGSQEVVELAYPSPAPAAPPTGVARTWAAWLP